MVKSVRTFNANDEVNLLIEEEAPKGKGFSKWINDKILAADNIQKNHIKAPKALINPP